jgi:transposase
MSADLRGAAPASTPAPALAPVLPFVARKKRKVYDWKPDMDDQIRQLYRAAKKKGQLSSGLRRLASTFGYSKDAITHRAQVLGVCQRRWKPWKPEEINLLRELVGVQPAREIARQLNRSYHSVKGQLERLNLSFELTEGYSINQLQKLIGMPAMSIRLWIGRKALKMDAGRITEASVRTFVFDHMEAYSFARCDEAWLKGQLNPAFGTHRYVRSENDRMAA